MTAMTRSAISPQQALIYVMVTISAVEGHIGDTELQEIGHLIKTLPIFKDFDPTRLTSVAQECGEILQEKEGLTTILGLSSASLNTKLRETAYALAAEVAAVDLVIGRKEMRFLAMLRDALGLDKLVTAALERSVIARYSQT